MADNNSSSIVAIFAIIVIVVVAAALVYYLFIATGVAPKSDTIINQPTKIIEQPVTPKK